MNNSTKPEEHSISTSYSIGLIGSLDICFYIINILFGVPTHSYIIRLIITGSGISSDFFILNLSVCEIGESLNCLFALLATLFPSFRTLALAFFGLFFIGRPLFQCLICVERYLAVIHPVTFLKFKPLRYRLMCCTAAWVICLVSCLSCVLLNLTNKMAYKGLFSTMFLILLSIQLFCCVAVLRALKQSGPGERGREREEENHMKKRAFHLILITAVSMFIAYAPYVILGFFAVMSKPLINSLWHIGFVFYVLCGFVQPVLYLNRAGKLSSVCVCVRSR